MITIWNILFTLYHYFQTEENIIVPAKLVTRFLNDQQHDRLRDSRRRDTKKCVDLEERHLLLRPKLRFTVLSSLIRIGVENVS